MLNRWLRYKIISIVGLVIACFTITQAQGVLLTNDEIDEVLTSEVMAELGLDYPIYRVYSYSDKLGKHYVVMMEMPVSGDDENFESIRAIGLLEEQNDLIREWSFRDFIQPQTREESIWFWSKYFSVQDFDEDGYQEPIVVYGSSAYNGTDDGRVKILIFYQGVKFAIRHQNGVLDCERSTAIDKEFYELPKPLQKEVVRIMKAIMTNDHGIFPADWEIDMELQKTYLEEC